MQNSPTTTTAIKGRRIYVVTPIFLARAPLMLVSELSNQEVCGIRAHIPVESSISPYKRDRQKGVPNTTSQLPHWQAETSFAPSSKPLNPVKLVSRVFLRNTLDPDGKTVTLGV